MNSFTFLNTKGELIDHSILDDNYALLLIYFRGDCDDCRKSAQFLNNSASDYPVQIWMVSPEPLVELQVFESMFKLYDIDNLKILQDHTKSMHDWFDFRYLPFVVLFDNQRKEVKRFEKIPTSKEVMQLLISN